MLDGLLQLWSYGTETNPQDGKDHHVKQKSATVSFVQNFVIHGLKKWMTTALSQKTDEEGALATYKVSVPIMYPVITAL